MPSNSFGDIFRITTWGESHGVAMGVIIDGCPSGIAMDEETILKALQKRRPGMTSYTSPRKEADIPKILSGVFEGKTTGAPLSILIENSDAQGQSYTALKYLLRPGHANYTYLHKYGIFDYRGGGRASGRETVCRVAAGAVAKAILEFYGIQLIAFLHQMGKVVASYSLEFEKLQIQLKKSDLFCPDSAAETLMKQALENVMEEGDSLGGIVALLAVNLPAGLGDPVYEKLEANLAKAMLSIPASKGFEIGEGFGAAAMKGSEHNDAFHADATGKISLMSNHSGGTLGGISTGEPLWMRVAFKPTSSLKKTQQTTTLSGENTEINLQEGARHDPCLAIRAVPVVEAMAAIVIVDALLKNRLAQLEPGKKDDFRGQGSSPLPK